MASKIGLWLLIKIAEALTGKYMTAAAGEARRTKVIDYLIVRAEKAKASSTSADNDVLAYWAGIMKSERLKEALKS